MCPDDPNAGKNETTVKWVGMSQGFHGNYVTCAGSGPVGNRSNVSVPALLALPNNGSRTNGMFRASLPVSAAAVIDGLSNTLMMSEILLWLDGEGNDLRGRYWNTLWLDSSFTSLWPPNTSLTDVADCYGPYPSGAPPCIFGNNDRVMYARSNHSGGVCATLGDGSTRFISNFIEVNVYRALGSRNGQEGLATE